MQKKNKLKKTALEEINTSLSNVENRGDTKNAEKLKKTNQRV
jgi:hypothetical protein